MAKPKKPTKRAPAKPVKVAAKRKAASKASPAAKRALDAAIARAQRYAATIHQQVELGNYLVDSGLAQIGDTLGLNNENAMIVFPDDEVAALLNLIEIKALETGVPSEDVAAGVIAMLQGSKPMALLN